MNQNFGTDNHMFSVRISGPGKEFNCTESFVRIAKLFGAHRDYLKLNKVIFKQLIFERDIRN